MGDKDVSSEYMRDVNQQLEWTELREKLHDISVQNDNNFVNKIVSKTKENPLVPIGICATTFCLTYGLIAMRRGDSRKQQLMMRGRVLAQGFTVMAL
ncbi:unnamed protein product, partial [Oppiella nova]